MAVEVVVSRQQVHWPWLQEIGILHAILSIFVPLEKCPVNPIPRPALPWMYTNFVLDRVQLVVPLSEELLRVHDRVDKVNSQS